MEKNTTSWETNNQNMKQKQSEGRAAGSWAAERTIESENEKQKNTKMYKQTNSRGDWDTISQTFCQMSSNESGQ